MTSSQYAQLLSLDYNYLNPYTSYSGKNNSNMNPSQQIHAPSPQRPGRSANVLYPEPANTQRRSSSAQRYTPIQYQQPAQQQQQAQQAQQQQQPYQADYTNSPLNPYRPQVEHHPASYAPGSNDFPPAIRQHSHPSNYHRPDCTCDCECCFYDSEPDLEYSTNRRRSDRRASKSSDSRRSSKSSSSRRRHSSTDKMAKSKPLSKKDVIKNYVFGTPIENY